MITAASATKINASKVVPVDMDPLTGRSTSVGEEMTPMANPAYPQPEDYPGSTCTQ